MGRPKMEPFMNKPKDLVPEFDFKPKLTKPKRPSSAMGNKNHGLIASAIKRAMRGDERPDRNEAMYNFVRREEQKK